MKTKVVMSSSGAVALMNSAEMIKHIDQISQRIAKDAGDGFVGDVQAGKTRARGMVKSTDIDSMLAQSLHSALTKAIR